MVGTRTSLRKFLVKPSTALAGALLATFASTAQARVTKIVVEKQVSPAFNGASFGTPVPTRLLPGAPSASSIPMTRSIQSSRTSSSRRATDAEWSSTRLLSSW